MHRSIGSYLHFFWHFLGVDVFSSEKPGAELLLVFDTPSFAQEPPGWNDGPQPRGARGNGRWGIAIAGTLVEQFRVKVGMVLRQIRQIQRFSSRQISVSK